MGKSSRAPHEQLAVIAAYRDVASKVLPRHLSPDRCVNATAICLRVLRKYRVPAEAISVEAECHNADAGLAVDKDGDPYSAFLSKEPGTEGWIGHVVAVAAGLLIDSAASQMSRPPRGILVPEVLLVPLQYPPPEDGWQSFISSGSGIVVRYRAHPEDRGHLELPGWRNPYNRRVVREIVKGMKRLVER